MDGRDHNLPLDVRDGAHLPTSSSPTEPKSPGARKSKEKGGRRVAATNYGEANRRA